MLIFDGIPRLVDIILAEGHARSTTSNLLRAATLTNACAQAIVKRLLNHRKVSTNLLEALIKST